jgi:magnesium transporter
LITSGRPRGKDDIDDEDEEEAAIGLMDGEYQDESIEDPPTEGGRRGRDLTLSTNFYGKGASSTSPRREFLPVDDDQSLTPRRLRTPSPTRRPSVAFEDVPTREEDRDSLLSNPWETSQERLPTVETLSRINTTQSTPPSFHPASRSTSTIPQLDTPTQHRSSSRPSSPPKTDPRSSLSGLSRRSMSRILPGPLISPLSSSLSGVVADSLRRGVGAIDGTPSRRRLPRLGGALKRARTTRGTRSNTREDRDPDRFLRSAEPQDGVPEEGAEENGERKKRMRSFSDALGWLSRGESRKKQRDGEDEGGTGAGNGLTGATTPDPKRSRETVG